MLSCNFCAKTFKFPKRLSYHMLSHTKEKPHKCHICAAAFGVEGNLKKHVKSVHDGIKEIKHRNTHCPLCSYTCCNKTELERHVRKHSAEQPFSCDKPCCGFKTKYKTALLRHVRDVHSGERPYECTSDGCNYKAKTKTCLKQHLSTHSSERPFACTVTGCNYTSKTKRTLESHTCRAHSNYKRFKCSTCNFRTKIKRNLVQHQHQHKEIKRFQCQTPNCGFSTKSKKKVMQHFDAKHSKKDIRCTEPGCNYWCSSMFLLKHHLKIHRNPRLKCLGDECHFSTRLHCGVPDCGYQTKFRQHYNRHKITHKKEEKWQHVCPFCFSRFHKLSVLQYHVQRHTQEKPYSCSFCKYTAVTSGVLRSHAARMHHIHVNRRRKEDEERKCRTCGRNFLCNSEFLVHSMTHLQAVVVLEQLKLHVL